MIFAVIILNSCVSWTGSELPAPEEQPIKMKGSIQATWKGWDKFGYSEPYRIPRLTPRHMILRFNERAGRADDKPPRRDFREEYSIRRGFSRAGLQARKGPATGDYRIEITAFEILQPIDKNAGAVSAYSINLIPFNINTTVGLQCLVRDRKGKLQGIFTPYERMRTLLWLPLWPVGLLKGILELPFDTKRSETDVLQRVGAACARAAANHFLTPLNRRPAWYKKEEVPLGSILGRTERFAVIIKLSSLKLSRGARIITRDPDGGARTGSGRVAGVNDSTITLRIDQGNPSEGDRVYLAGGTINE